MEIDITNLKNALETLKISMQKLEENLSSDVVDMLEDACVKRFEYTLEIARKTMKKILKKVYAIEEGELTVNNVFRYMQGYDFISNWETWRAYYEKRNNTAHEYDYVKSRSLLELVPQFITDAEYFIQKVESK